MKKVILFIAASLDGYIADRRGGVGWLKGQDDDLEPSKSYDSFIKGVDTIIMGWNTYRQVTEELAPGNWPYAGLTSYVVTHRNRPSTEAVKFTSENPGLLVTHLKQQSGKDIWVCGGSSVVQQLMREQLIDVFHISIIPTILGGGVRLWDTLEHELELQLVEAQNYNGIAELIYERRQRSC